MSQAQQGKATSLFAKSKSLLHTCSGCGYSSQHRYLYERHIKRCVALATGETYNSSTPRGRVPQLVHRNYRCKQCNFTTTKSKLFLAHRRAVHGDVIKIYPCDICEYASKYKSKLLRHRNLKHKGAGEYSEENAGYMSEETAEDLLRNASNHLHIAINGDNGIHGASNTLAIAFNNNIGDRVLRGNDGDTPDKVDRIQVKEEPKFYHEHSNQDEDSQEEEGQPHQDYKESDICREEGLLVQEREGSPADNTFNFITESGSSGGRPLSQCALCNYSNPHKWKVANHVRSFHMKKKLFKCSECDFVTGRKIEFCVHKAKTHATSKVYSCIECSYCTISRTNYERHINNHVGGGPIKCTYCSYSSTGEAAVIRHMQEYHPKQQMTPSTLKKPAQAKAALVPLQSVFAADRNKPVPSQDLSGSNYSDSTYRPHKSATEMEIKVQKFTPTKKIGSDILSFAKKVAGKTGNEVDCPVCGITFKTEARLRIHMVSHSDEASHHCPLCSLKYKRTSDLNRHMKKKHDAKLRDFFYMGMQEQPLNLSVRAEAVPSSRSSQVARITCEDQPLDLSMKPKPEVIQVPSVTSKPYRGPYSPEELKCSLCSYLAKWPSDLKRHALVHSMEKRYKCEQCQRRYKYQFDLNMHMRRSHHMPTGRPRVSNVLPNEVSSPLSGGMSLPTQVLLSPEPVPTSSVSSDSQSPPRMRSASVPPQYATPPDQQDDSNPLASLCPLLPTPSPPPLPIQVNVPMEVVFAPSSVHDMENTLPPSMQRVAEPIEKPTSNSATLENQPGPPVEQRLLTSNKEKCSNSSKSHKDERVKLSSIAVEVAPLATEQAIRGMAHKSPRVMKMKAMKPQRLSSLTAARKFKCKYCPYLGLYQSEVDRHTRLHTGEKPYKCIYCVYRSAWKGDMKRHIIKHHAPEIARANSLESIIEFCCKSRTDEHRNSSYDNKSPESGNFDISDVDSDADLLCSDEDDVVEMKIKTVKNQNHEDEDGEKEKELIGKNDTLGNDKMEEKHLDYNGNKHTSAQEGRCAENKGSEEKGDLETESARAVENEDIDIHEDLKRFKCDHCGKRLNWLWDIRKHIKKDHPGKAMMVATLSEKEARATAKTCVNSPVLKIIGKVKAGRKTSADDEENKQRSTSNDENSDDEDGDIQSDGDVKEDEVTEEWKKDVVADDKNVSKANIQNTNREAKKKIDDVDEENNNVMKFAGGNCRGKKYRPYKCSACPRRSNWRWDIMKHIRKIHPSAKMITLSEDVAKATFNESVMKRPKGQGLKAQKKLEREREQVSNEQENKPAVLSKGDTKQKQTPPKNALEKDENTLKSVKNIKVKMKETSNVKEANIPFKKRKLEISEGKQEKQQPKQSSKKKSIIPKTFVAETIPRSPKKAKVETIRCKGSKESKTKQNIPGTENQDEIVKNGPNNKPILRCLKRYKCFYCPYRSNYRSDIGRHGKRLHRKQQLKVVILDEEEAASTLQDYRQKYAKKKFVLTSSDAEERVRRKPKQSEKCNQSKNVDRPIQVVWMSESAQFSKSSKIPRSLPEERIDLTKCHAKSSGNHLSSRILIDQSNVLTRCCEFGAMVCSCHSSNNNGATCQLLHGATQMRSDSENALPK